LIVEERQRGMKNGLPLLFKQMGLPLSGHWQYLLDLYEKIPAVNACGIVTEDGGYYS